MNKFENAEEFISELKRAKAAMHFQLVASNALHTNTVHIDKDIGEFLFCLCGAILNVYDKPAEEGKKDDQN